MIRHSFAARAAPRPRHITAAVEHKQQLRGQLHHITLAWVYGSIWMFTISGAAMTQFAKALGTPDYGFGWLAALPFVGTFMQLPAIWVQQRYGWRKTLFIICLTTGRLMWVVAAAIPWMLPDQRAWWWPTMIGVLLVSRLTMQAGGPAWMNWMSEVIPRRVRGRYFAQRNLIGRPIGMLSALLVGEMLDLGLSVAGHDSDIMLHITSVILAIGGLLGALDVLEFLKVHDPAPPKTSRQANFFANLRKPLADANFRCYLAFNFLFMLAIGFIGQYIWLYLFDVCHWSNRKANLLVMVVPLSATMLTYKMWGRLNDRLGLKPVLLITGIAVTFGSMGWLLIDEQRMIVGYVWVLLVVLFWPGMEIANFNIALGMAGGKNSNASEVGIAYVTINALAVALGGALSGLLAGTIASQMEGFTYVLPFAGIVLTYHGVLFLISTVLRGVSLIFVMRMHEPQATPTSEAFRYMTTALYSNVRQATLMPTRIVGKVARFSYRIRN